MDFIHRALPYAFAIAPLGHLNNYHTTFYKNYQFDSYHSTMLQTKIKDIRQFDPIVKISRSGAATAPLREMNYPG
jgi:hypothetical protein